MNNCPVCGSDDVESSSNAEIRLSTARCHDCDFNFQAPVPEEDIHAMWNVIEHFSENDRPDDTPSNVKCPDCGKSESPPFCEGDECICGGILVADLK